MRPSRADSRRQRSRGSRPGFLARAFYVRLLLALTLALAACSKAPQRPDIVLITVDTLRADHVGAVLEDGPTTPFLDSWSRDAVVFRGARTTVPRTTPALASLLTGQAPSTTRVRTLWDRLDDGQVTLAEDLTDAGYRSVAVVSNHIVGPERGLDRGFAIYDFADDSRLAPATTARALKLATEGSAAPLFLWVHYIDPHLPYRPPADLRPSPPTEAAAFADGFGTHHAQPDTGRVFGFIPEGLDKAELTFANPLPPVVVEHVRRLYAAEVRAVDRAIEALVSGLDQRRDRPRVTIVTADHGESLGEHDYHWDHGDYVWASSLDVPLMIQTPEGRGAVYEDAVSLVDVAPTIRELAGVATRPSAGLTLTPLLEGASRAVSPVFAESGFAFHPERVRGRVRFDVEGRLRSVIHGQWKLIWTPGAEAPWQLYNLGTDPAESEDLWTRDHRRGRELRALLQAHVEAEEPATSSAPGAVDQDRLRSLGYLQ